MLEILYSIFATLIYLCIFGFIAYLVSIPYFKRLKKEEQENLQKQIEECGRLQTKVKDLEQQNLLLQKKLEVCSQHLQNLNRLLATHKERKPHIESAPAVSETQAPPTQPVGLPKLPGTLLPPEKENIFNFMEETNTNLFITGKAGTGKSYLLKYFVEHTCKRVLICAPTGIAALNIDGVTLHSAFGFDNLKNNHWISLSANQETLLQSIDVLLIDEISMVRSDVFNQISKCMELANNTALPFGGKQVLLFGDLFQLPPIVDNKEDAKMLSDQYGGIFFFHAPAYKCGRFQFQELHTVYRQNEKTDPRFLSALDHIRNGKIKEEEIVYLNKRFRADLPNGVIRLVSTKATANKMNREKLASISEREYVFKEAIHLTEGETEVKETDFPCDLELHLKVGAMVMMITNDAEKHRWVNGTMGIISDLSDQSVKVRINNSVYEVSPHVFSKKRVQYNTETQELEYIEAAYVKQYPLILAYAITIHKSQGKTYEKAICDLSQCFAAGQAYVALSRCSCYEGLYLTKPVTAKAFITNQTVINFYENIKTESR